MKAILKHEVSASNGQFRVSLSYIGSSETSDNSEPMLYIDIEQKDESDKRRWDGERGYHSFTNKSARVSLKEAKEMCKKVLDNLSGCSNEFDFERAWKTALNKLGFTVSIERDGKTYELTEEEIGEISEVHVKNFYVGEILDNFTDVPAIDVEDLAESAYIQYCRGDGRTEYECLEDAYQEYMSEKTA